MIRNTTIFCITLFLSFSYLSNNAETIIEGGPVQGEWDLNGSPYIIESDIWIDTGTILTIHAGVEIIFNNNVKFEVFGNLVAIGTENSSILFTKSDQTSDRWAGIHIYNNSPEIKHCTFSYTKEIFGQYEAALSFNSYFEQDIEVNSCTFNNNDNGAILINCYNENYSFFLHDCNFNNNADFCVKTKASSLDKINIENNSFIGSKSFNNIGLLFEYGNICDLISFKDNLFSNFYTSEEGYGSAVNINHENSRSSINISFNNDSLSHNESLTAGAILINNCETLTINNVLFNSNKGERGAIISYCRYVDIISNNFITNQPIENTGGGSLEINLLNNGTIFLDNNEFRSNKLAGANQIGGDVLVNVVNDVNSIEITNNLFKSFDNTAKGGAITINGENNTSNNIIVEKNTFNDVFGLYGGSIYINNVNVETLDIDSNLFIETSAYNGGGIYIQSNSVNTFDLFYNTIKSSFAIKNGGFIYANIDQVDICKLHHNIQDSSFVISSTTENGGFLYYYSTYTGLLEINNDTINACGSPDGNGGYMNIYCVELNSFSFYENMIKDSSFVGHNGGALYLKSNNNISNISIHDNAFGKSTAGVSGGNTYIKCPEVHSFSFNNNNLNQISSATFNGGVLFLDVENSIDDLDIFQNTFHSSKATTGSGGMAFISAESIGPVDFYENTVSSSSMAGDNGGLLYLNANTSIGDITLDNNTAQSTSATNNGGFASISTLQTGLLTLTNNT
ncbi:MAG: hypothetical protein KAT48_12885, partial [Bacteroidales bacterium]|nr:hypothetical protein [Bacteroidales bacterium]